ncbi:MAG: hypothetical protein ABI409_09865 [Ramlibacter sp.]
MKRRHLYVLVFALPALLASVMVASALFGAVAGVLWLFVFGDNAWPSSVDTVLVPLAAVALAAMWAALLSRAYAFGKRQEQTAAPMTRHVAMAAAATVLIVLLGVSYQWRVANIGPKDDGTLCSDFCRDKGYAGSGMPPRNQGAATCSCFDGQGREAVKVPMGEVPGRRE